MFVALSVLQQVFAGISLVLFAILCIQASVWMQFEREQEGSFECAHCRTPEKHSLRTFRAWQEGKRKFFCSDCHGKWRREHPASIADRNGGMFWRFGEVWILLGIVVTLTLAYWS